MHSKSIVDFNYNAHFVLYACLLLHHVIDNLFQISFLFIHTFRPQLVKIYSLCNLDMGTCFPVSRLY